MKKILHLLLIGVICMGLFGCSVFTGHSTQKERQTMLAHLEEKYGEKFIIRSIDNPILGPSSTIGVSVYPEGREDEYYYVEITRKNRIFIDNYVVREPEKRMQPFYEEWVQSIIPEAKVAVRLGLLLGGTKEVVYNPDETLQQFVSGADKLSIEVNIMLSETLLENKDDVFEKLSKALETEPITGYESSSYRIGFFVQDAFENIKSGEYGHILMSINSEAAINLAAVTYCNIKIWNENKVKTQPELLEQLNYNFKIKEEYVE